MENERLHELKTEINTAINLAEGLDEPQNTIFITILKSLRFIISDPTVINESNTREKEDITIIAFLKDNNIKNHSDRVIGMGYFLCKFKKIDPFNIKNIQEMYSEARIKEPKNLSDIIKKQVNKDYLLEKGKTEGLNFFCITMDGIEYIKSLKE